jgi:SAM-dependent methyltransferase
MKNSITIFLRVIKKSFLNIYMVIIYRTKKQKNLSEEFVLRSQRVLKLIERLFPSEILKVLNGPFKNMYYIDESSGSQLLPKIIGSYEEPIHKWICHIINNDTYDAIVDVGCAEGYYACGFAVCMKSVQIFAYDIDAHALCNAKKLALLNNQSGRINFASEFDLQQLDFIARTFRNKKVLIFMDVEGAEHDLLDPRKFPDILKMDIIVELHDCFRPNLTEDVINYLHETHYIEVVFDYPWRGANYDTNKAKLTIEESCFAMDERRPSRMRWMYARAKFNA